MCVRILFGIFLTLSPVWNLKRWKTNQQVSLRQPACHSAGQSVLWPIFQWQRHSDGQPSRPWLGAFVGLIQLGPDQVLLRSPLLTSLFASANTLRWSPVRFEKGCVTGVVVTASGCRMRLPPTHNATHFTLYTLHFTLSTAHFTRYKL